MIEYLHNAIRATAGEAITVSAKITDENGLPIYCKEDLITHEEKGETSGTAFDVGTRCFYDMMYEAIVNNKEMEIKPEYAAMVISVIEQVHAENPLPILF